MPSIETINKPFICPYCHKGTFTTDNKDITKPNAKGVIYHHYECNNNECKYNIDYPVKIN